MFGMRKWWIVGLRKECNDKPVDFVADREVPCEGSLDFDTEVINNEGDISVPILGPYP